MKLSEAERVYLQEMIAHALVALQRRPRGEVTGPESVRVGRVGEEVIALGRPRVVRLVQCFQIARWRRVEQIEV